MFFNLGTYCIFVLKMIFCNDLKECKFSLFCPTFKLLSNGSSGQYKKPFLNWVKPTHYSYGEAYLINKSGVVSSSKGTMIHLGSRTRNQFTYLRWYAMRVAEHWEWGELPVDFFFIRITYHKFFDRGWLDRQDYKQLLLKIRW